MVTVTRHPDPTGINSYTRACVSHDEGVMSAIKYDTDEKIRIVFCDKYGNTSYPMLTKNNKSNWDKLINSFAK